MHGQDRVPFEVCKQSDSKYHKLQCARISTLACQRTLRRSSTPKFSWVLSSSPFSLNNNHSPLTGCNGRRLAAPPDLRTRQQQHQDNHPAYTSFLTHQSIHASNLNWTIGPHRGFAVPFNHRFFQHYTGIHCFKKPKTFYVSGDSNSSPFPLHISNFLLPFLEISILPRLPLHCHLPAFPSNSCPYH